MSNSRNLADLDIGVGGLLPASNMATGAAVSNIGYTPVNNAGGTMTGALTATGFTGPLTGNAATATNVAYSGLTGTVPTWNQSTTGNAATATTTTGNAATATNVAYSGLTGTVPTWNQNTTGTATGLSATLAVASGGTGNTTAQAEMNRVAAAVTSGQYLRGNGTDVVMASIVATDLPNTTVSAGSYTYSSITVDAQGRLTAASNGASPSAFPAGTVMLFVQTAAPTGWTKSTTHDNKALRVVSGTASSGGSTAFSTVFSNQTPTITTSGLSAGNTTLTTAQIPSHTHTFPSYTASAGNGLSNFSAGGGVSSGATGGGGSHSHSISGSASSSAITLNVQYVDVIIATKD